MSVSCFHTNKVSKLVKYSRVTHYKTRPPPPVAFIAPLETANIEGDRCWDDRIINKQHPWYKYVTGCNHVHLLITVIDIKSPYCCPAIYLMKILLIIHLAEAFDISHPSDGKIMHARVLESQLNKSVYINRTPVYHYIYFKHIYRCYYNFLLYILKYLYVRNILPGIFPAFHSPFLFFNPWCASLFFFKF